MDRCRDLHLEREDNWLASFNRRYIRIPFNDQFALCATAISALPLKHRLSNAANFYSSVKHFPGLGVCTQLTMYVLCQGYCGLVLGFVFCFFFLLSRGCGSDTSLSAPEIT